MLIKRTPTPSDIVVFGSPCALHRDAKNKSLGERGKAGLIIEASDVIKGSRVYILIKRIVIVTQHVRNIEMLPCGQKEQLRRLFLEI